MRELFLHPLCFARLNITINRGLSVNLNLKQIIIWLDEQQRNRNPLSSILEARTTSIIIIIITIPHRGFRNSRHAQSNFFAHDQRRSRCCYHPSALSTERWTSIEVIFILRIQGRSQNRNQHPSSALRKTSTEHQNSRLSTRIQDVRE